MLFRISWCITLRLCDRKILDAIDVENPTPESRTKAYIYGFLAFACTLLKVFVFESTLRNNSQHLYRPKQMFSIYGLDGGQPLGFARS